MSYATYDFQESVMAVGVDPASIKRVLRAWGAGDGMGEGATGYKWSAEGVTDWKGGFLCQMQDGSYRYITGWCDYTGWGCQDGAIVLSFDHAPTHDEIVAAVAAHEEGYSYDGIPAESEWDVEPADLNKWIAGGAKDSDGD